MSASIKKKSLPQGADSAKQDLVKQVSAKHDSKSVVDVKNVFGREDGVSPSGDPLFEWNGLMRLWRLLEPTVQVLVDVGTGREPTFPDNGRVIQHCFEPNDSGYRSLEQFRRPYLFVNKLALGAHPSLSEPFYSHGETMHFRTVLDCSKDCGCRTSVQMTTLDQYCTDSKLDNQTQIDLLNIAVSGGELNVLKGATQTLKHTKLVLFEYGGTYFDAKVRLTDMFDFLQSNGFKFICLVLPNALAPASASTLKEDGILRYYVAARSQEDLVHSLTWSEVPKTMDDIRYGQKFEQIMTLPFVKEVQLDLKTGFNLCLRKEDGSRDGYAGVFRRTKNPNDGWGNLLTHSPSERRYPETENVCFSLTLDKDFTILHECELKETCERTKHRSFSTGVEDARLLDSSSFIATTLDTNPDWHAQISFATLSQNNTITRIQPLSISGFHGTEKNWLPLRRWGNELHVLHWCNPLRIVRVDLQTGQGQVIKETFYNSLNLKAHGASAVQLSNNQFLVAVREYRRSHYAHSRLFVLDDQYDLVAVSQPFRFQNQYYYEMAMSMTVVTSSGLFPDEYLVVAVSLEDKIQKIYTYLLSHILHFLQ